MEPLCKNKIKSAEELFLYCICNPSQITAEVFKWLSKFESFSYTDMNGLIINIFEISTCFVVHILNVPIMMKY